MIKFLLIIIFIRFILIYNKKIVFFYNLCYIMSFIFLFIFIFKDLLWINISIFFSGDLYSFYLEILSMWIMGLMFIIFYLDNYKKDVEKIFILILILIILVIFFSSLNLIIFYLMFELRLIPTFFLIIYWGINFERLRAAFYLLIYTMLISLPLLIYLFKIFKLNETFDLNLLILLIRLNWINLRIFDYLILLIAFLIKIPIYLFHVWLPKAHVEAPVYGSIILAAILLKLGGYGLLRFIEIFMITCKKYNYLIFRVGIIGRILVRLICLIQIDIKRLVAYSSVVHINILLCAIITIMKLGIIRAYIIIISHGLCSSGLFFVVNLYYERSGRRLLLFNKGIINLLPRLIVWWFILCVANFSFPFSLNFIREIYIIRVIIRWDIINIIYLILICFFRRAYSLYLCSYIMHGKISLNFKIYIISLKDFIILFIHIYPLIIILLNLIMFY